MLILVNIYIIGSQGGWLLWSRQKLITIVLIVGLLFVTDTLMLNNSSVYLIHYPSEFHYPIWFWGILGYLTGIKAGFYLKRVGKHFYFLTILFTLFGVCVGTVFIQSIVLFYLDFKIIEIYLLLSTYITLTLISIFLILHFGQGLSKTILNLALKKNVFTVFTFVGLIETISKFILHDFLYKYSWSIWIPKIEPTESYKLFFTLCIAFIASFPVNKNVLDT